MLGEFVIYSQSETDLNPDLGPAFWSNDDGWVGLSDATRFTQEETTCFYLPVGASCWMAVQIAETALREWYEQEEDDQGLADTDAVILGGRE